MVAVKLWFYYGISNLKASALMCKHSILQPQYTDNPQNICEEVFTNTHQSYHRELIQAGNSLTDVSGHYPCKICEMIRIAVSLVALCNCI